MAGFNQAIVMGRIAIPPDLKYTSKGTAVAEFTLVTSEKTKRDGEVSHFFECESYGKVAEGIAKYTTKGDVLLVNGRMRQDRWETKDGQKRSKIKIVVSSFSFPPSNRRTKDEKPVVDRGSSGEALDDDIPF